MLGLMPPCSFSCFTVKNMTVSQVKARQRTPTRKAKENFVISLTHARPVIPTVINTAINNFSCWKSIIEQIVSEINEKKAIVNEYCVAAIIKSSTRLTLAPKAFYTTPLYE